MIQEKGFNRGLSTREAEKRIADHGLNELKHNKKKSPILIFLSQFNDFLVWVLIGATIVSGIIGDKADAVTILIIVVVNAILGFVQEFRTEKSLEALQELAAPTCKVIRDGNVKVVNSKYLTIGDLVVLESGDRIPADGTFIDTANIVVDESLLTGESVGISKDTSKGKNSGFMGTIVLKGRGLLLVDAIGMDTEMGKIANLLDNIEEEKSPLRERLDSLGKILVVVCIVVCVIVTVLGIIRGNDITEMFLLGVSLAVAAIPEGLAAIVTVALALGVGRMLKRNALIRKLPAVETLGCTSVICSDKTGTLTQNKMTVKEVLLNGKIYELDKESLNNCEKLKEAFIYCNDTNYNYEVKNIEKALMGDPTETALVKAFFKDVNSIQNFVDKANRVYEIPFDSTRKMMTVIMNESGKETLYMKGAPERVLEKCSAVLENGKIKILTPQKKKQLYNYIESMSNRALRCIAAAYKEEKLVKNESVENNLIFLGVAGSIDPARPEVKDAVMKCKLAGIKPVMITGDHKNTALAIAKGLNICTTDDQAITGEELEKMSDEELSKRVDKIRVFARVSPNHKLRIVKAFKKKNNIVAMTGDGVNDAPAIKEADIGVAMGISGTDVTKEAAAMVLMDDNFATIVSAVEEGRVIYDNIRKFIRYLLSCNLGEVLTMFLASLFYMPNPLTPIQILFVNLATDGLPAIALGVDPPDKDIMRQQPRQKNEGIFARGLWEKIIVRGCLIGVCTLLSFMVGRYYGMNLATCRTIALCTLVMSQLLHVFECRSERHSIFEINIFTNIYLLGAVLVSITMICCILYVPFLRGIFNTVALNLGQWLLVIFFSGIIFLINSVYLLIKSKK
ncbi:calcium-translocating P-type ATPase, PMCA-type [Clostridium celatum]|uniref:P-type Ca(2+) transporter n=1 Tax=Clostridium celatum DSM 1785 TaxID=545697 RepID=L1QNW3_9CLOT|nr:calcium-translocating P-type ATPase, PMCA-type [Clostridium celatum]EKY29380.1 calcium-translocating P-type ATPase, PMCA-type [Clostridium celatum DSM 1785]MCE9655374.1 calcium-translocating P-type ATPase, PMCA-type [Clostridium celatum]MDU2266182.1 calcium-translocating P-type ATPase, PMCA-type [Clostridium celatum]MDU3721877.1 calcium-translocating P-type ATPase, PMCA-type [Clostridium celatum]MDU6296475.1 calcium-translocating P-type ATPase, PMCA-type [Clostridium celatum]